MARGSLEQDLEKVAALRGLDDENEMREELRAALRDKRPMIAGKAARVAAYRALGDLAPEIATALDRLLGSRGEGDGEGEDEAHKPPDDPGCLGKTDLARALVDLDAEAYGVFLRGARCVQMEPVWGGQVDAAAELRACCAMGLAGTGGHRAAEVIADLLADPESAARSGAARALAASGRVGAELVLRFKARLGDDEPAVLLDTFSALLELEPTTGMEPIIGALASDDETRFEPAAIALGSSRNPDALAALTRALGRVSPWQPDRRKVLLRAIALLRGDDAADYLASLVAESPEDDAVFVLDVLGEIGVDFRLRERLAEAVDARGSRSLSRALRSLNDA